MLSLIAAVVAAASTPGAVAPKPVAAAVAIDPAALQAAAILVQQLDIRSQITATLAQNVQMMRSGVAIRSMLAQQPGFVPAYQANRAKFDAAMKKAGAIQAEVAEKIIRDNSQAVVNEAIRAYARNYTAAELRGLTEFFKSPLGQALNRQQPRVTAEIGMATGQIIGAKIDVGMQAAAPRLQAALAPLNTAAARPSSTSPAKK